MPIKPTTPTAEITRYMTDKIRRMKQALAYNLFYVGEQVVNHARSLPSPSAAQFDGKITPHQPNYIDWSKNLRSSIGYVVVIDGEVVQASSFEPLGDDTEGAKKGKEYALQLASEFPHSVALIVVAGMKYAAYVTAKGYDVIDSAELLADKLVPEMLKKLGII